MKITAVAHGAATIVNAIATGKGSAFGINLETKATVRLNDSGRIDAKIKGCPNEDTNLIKLCAKKVFEHLDVDHGAKIETQSEIPIAKGLKSSSAAANAVVLATWKAIAKEHDKEIKEIDDKAIINLGVDAAIDAGVTITGAFDDASASFFGGWVVTDNEKREILRSGEMERLNVLIWVPEKKTYTQDVDVEKTRLLSGEVMTAWSEAFRGDLYAAMTLNGILYSATLKQDPDIALEALRSGAIAAGLSGTGPGVVALVRVECDIDKVKESWDRFDGEIIETTVNNEKARILDSMNRRNQL